MPPAGLRISRAKSCTHLAGCWNRGCLLPARGRPAHGSGARAASFLQLNPNEVSLTLTLPASPQVELKFMVSHWVKREKGPLRKLRGSKIRGLRDKKVGPRKKKKKVGLET